MVDKTEFVKDTEWNKYRDIEGCIDILQMYSNKNADKMCDGIHTRGQVYLESVMTISPIRSRQVAAVAMVTAATIDTLIN